MKRGISIYVSISLGKGVTGSSLSSRSNPKWMNIQQNHTDKGTHRKRVSRDVQIWSDGLNPTVTDKVTSRIPRGI